MAATTRSKTIEVHEQVAALAHDIEEHTEELSILLAAIDMLAAQIAASTEEQSTRDLARKLRHSLRSGRLANIKDSLSTMRLRLRDERARYR